MKEIMSIFYVLLFFSYWISIIVFMIVLTRKPSTNPKVNRFYFNSYSTIFFLGLGFNLFTAVLTDSEIKQFMYLFFALCNLIGFNSTINSEFLKTKYSIKD